MTNKKILNLIGVSEGGVAATIAAMEEVQDSPLLVVAENAKKAQNLAMDLSFFFKGNKNIYILGENIDSFFTYEARDKENQNLLISTLFSLLFEENSLVIIPAGMLLKKVPAPYDLKNSCISFEIGGELILEELKENLVGIGYERTAMVEAKGQFSIRGSIVDIFAPNLDNAIRLELFDTEIDSLKYFDIETQRTLKTVKKATIAPSSLVFGKKESFLAAVEKINREYGSVIAKLEKSENSEKYLLIEELEKTRGILEEAFVHRANLQLAENYISYFTDDAVNIWDYPGEKGICIISDYDRVTEEINSYVNTLKMDFETLLSSGRIIEKDFKNLADTKALRSFYENTNMIVFTPFLSRLKGMERKPEIRNIPFRSGSRFAGRIEAFVDALKYYMDADYKVTIVCKNKESAEKIGELFRYYNIGGKIFLEIGLISSSFEFTEAKEAYISEEDIFSKQIRKKLKSKSEKRELKDKRQVFIELNKGDYVVHEEYGIGKFIGIEEMSIESEKKDYLKIKYAGTDMVYLPVENMGVVQKYIGGDTENIKLSKLGGAEWKTSKAKAHIAVEEMAKKLLELSASRSLEKGFAFSEDGQWQKDFENDFPYEETGDQLRCIREIKEDMQKPLPMDRLLCGDVGFGKTEVAARAIFKCIADGKQAAFLVPTTILANQHYITLKERFSKFPCEIDLLCRFRSEKEQKKTVEKLAKGQVDIIIGTHRILSDDVKFKDLGLLVVDEEQRFGVEAKEKLKMLSKNVDVLTMSATPIPRTLNMSLVGIKNMSLIEEPPRERYPVQTYVLEEDDEMLKSAIQREVNRGGQVYVIFNRVRGLEKLANRLRDLLPDLNIEAAHGQMSEKTLEKRMLSFMAGEIQVLVATTILESGIDIPNANTLIVIDADNLGLSQLYQLRGRVGRSNRIAYAYLMFKKNKVMTELAQKRLRSIKEFTEFGAGFKIAMKDMEIRGAGNILGASQHGHIVAIGYELYCKLVDDAVKKMTGEEVNSKLFVNTNIEMKLNAYIPKKYINDEVQKIQMYRKIAGISGKEAKEDVIDELIDRFGKIPKDTLNLIDVSLIRNMAGKYNIEKVKQDGDYIFFDLTKGENLEMSHYAALTREFGNRITIFGSMDVRIRFFVKEKDKLGSIIDFLEVLNRETEKMKKTGARILDEGGKENAV